MADEPLQVFHERRPVGRLAADPLSFTYDPTWLAAPDAFALSVALPLRPARR